MRYVGAIRKKTIQVIYTFLAFSFMVILLFKCNEIPLNIVDLRSNEMKDSTQFVLDSNPYSFYTMFSLHDISKKEYRYLLPENYKINKYSFQSIYQGTQWSRTGHSLEFPGSDTFLVFHPDFPEISFYTKYFLSENLQSIRSFFLTEICTFFFAIFCLYAYELFQLHYRQKYGRSYNVSRKSHLKISAWYALSSVIVILLIIVICKSPTRTITSPNYHASSSYNFFMPYDISQTYYHFNISSEDLKSDTILWSSDEIVEFSQIGYGQYVQSRNSVTFTGYKKSEPFITSFYTKNLVSQNIQDIRLFFLSTIWLLIVARCFVHLKLYFGFR